MSYIESYKNQNYLLPLDIRDLFPKDHVCYLIEQIADNINYSEFDALYAGAGHPAYHPRINVKLLLMAYVDGIRSSRKIAKNSNENVVYISLAEKTSPDFRTICDFRKDNKELLKNVIKEINTFAIKHNLLDLSQLIIDGTVIKANANKKYCLDENALKKLDKYIENIIEEGIKIDEEEDNLFGDKSFHELPIELSNKEKRNPIVEKIVNEINKNIKGGNKKELLDIKDEVNKVQQELKKNDTKILSLTDAESRYMMNKDGKKEFGYNAQLVVDKNGFIISNDVVQDCDDRNQLLPSINNVENNYGILPKGTKILADAGFENYKAIETLDNRGFDLYVPGKNMISRGFEEKKFAKANFIYDFEKDVYICPAKKLLENVGTYFRKDRCEHLIMYQSSQCQNCPDKLECCKNANQKEIHALPQDKLMNKMKDKLRSEEGREIYDKRKETVERSFADIKHNKNFRYFLLRGLKGAKTEWDLACAAHNLVLINNKVRGTRNYFAS